MIQRVNFLEKGAYALTYRNMIICAMGMCLFCLVIHGIFLARYAMVNGDLRQSKKAIQELTQQKERVLAMVQAAQGQRTSTSAVQSLAFFFSKMPTWSAVLSELANKMPKQIWLETLRSENLGEQSEIKKVEIIGKGSSTGSIAKFVRDIDESKILKNVALVNSQKEQNGFSFLIRAEVLFPQVQW